MGNSSASKVKATVAIPHAEELEKLFHDLCDYGVMSPDRFKEHFSGPSVSFAQNLYNRFFIDLVNEAKETRSLFVERSHKILETVYLPTIQQAQFYCDLMYNKEGELNESDIQKIVYASFQYGVISSHLPGEGSVNFKDSDSIIHGIVSSFVKGNEIIARDDFVDKSSSINLFGGLQIWLYYKFTSKILKANFEMLPQPFECSLSTKLLSPTLFWLLCSTLPACYLKLENKFKSMESEPENSEEDVETKFTWNLLYESNEHGLTLNRFKNKVMGYKSPTILLMEISNNHILILALDQPWTDSADKFGGSYCRLIEAVPKVHVVEENVNMVYLKENSRALPTGLIIGAGKQPKVKIAPDLETIDLLYRGRKNDNVERIEVWGCGGVEAINSQADLKKWERKEVEKRKKVKLPGQWDTDKAILEMGGVTVNHSQRGDI